MSHSRHNIPIFITPTKLVAMTMILYNLCTVWLLNLPCVCICKGIACMYVIVSIKRLTVPGGMNVIVCTDLWGDEPYSQMCVGIVVTSGSLCGEMVAHWPRMLDIGVRVPLYAQYSPFSSHPRHIYICVCVYVYTYMMLKGHSCAVISNFRSSWENKRLLTYEPDLYA